MVIDRAFILAAGLGKRLRPYTDTMPKPMVPVDGRAIIDHVIDRLVESGIKRIGVNLHYKADMLADHLGQRRDVDIFLSHEETLLETGGGIKKALPQIGNEPFFVVSGDSFWTEGAGPKALERMETLWDENRMDLLLLMQPLSRMVLTEGRGDYFIKPDGHAVRALDQGGTHMWTSVRLCAPKLFEGSPDGAFSFLQLMDKAQSQGRLFGLEHTGEWHHISTPDDLDRVNAHLRRGTQRRATPGL